jgi:hypothetical protein
MGLNNAGHQRRWRDRLRAERPPTIGTSRLPPCARAALERENARLMASGKVMDPWRRGRGPASVSVPVVATMKIAGPPFGNAA